MLLLAVRAGSLFAQDTTRATLRGVVVAAETGERIAYAVVMLEPLVDRRFTDDAGGFAFLRLSPGSYRLRVRQVGYSPFDSTVAISSATPSLRVELQHIAVRLEGITVASAARCDRPPLPSSWGADLSAVFEQLRLNAQRYALLLDQYPFRYAVIRQLTDHLGSGLERTLTDTFALRSDARWPYAPGHVVTDSPNQARGTKDVHLPILADFADSTFQATHCFHYGGLEDVEGRSLLRIDFQASERLRDPDVDGSVFLDPVHFQVLLTRVTLTRLNRAASGVTGWTASAWFREIVPNLIVVERMSAVTGLSSNGSRIAVVGRTEQQRLATIAFVRPLPAAADSVR